MSCYETYGPAFMRRDLSNDLGPAFAGEFLNRYVPPVPRAWTPVFHSVGASDPIDAVDVTARIDDGLPNTLEEWIARDGLTRFKIKLNGGNDAADFDRIVRVDRTVRRLLAPRRVDWKYLLDFNEGCPNVGYLLDLLGAGEGGNAQGLRPHPLHRAADRPRPGQGPRQRDARGGEALSGSSRRVADRSLRRCSWPGRWATAASR